MFIKHQIKPFLSVLVTKIEIKLFAQICVNTDILLYFFLSQERKSQNSEFASKREESQKFSTSGLDPLLRMLLWDMHAHRLTHS